MSNIQEVKRKPVNITLKDGVERTIVFDLNAMAELEDKYGSVDAAFAKLDEGSFKAIRFVLWAGLVHAEPELTEHKVGSLIDMQFLTDLMSSLGGALNADMPGNEDVPVVQGVVVDNSNPNA